ncbi:hypothetical protein K438DRAFT_1811046 [Mycena galopus ATCC 62051]|nr:hypothetical protein K438DRAFT_1811046 [Mycena galopus ATCC 62051]
MDVDQDQAQDAQNAPKRVEELWFSDGGIVVRAEKSLFRVSRAVLAARSPVFRDMLSFTQPPDAEKIEGCPVVELPDSAEDVACFFRAIFDSSFFEPHPSKVVLEHVISIARLSHKYAVDYLLRRALVHLSSEYPTTLSAYDALPIGDHGDDWIPMTIAVSRLARQVNALWVLPVAFYNLAETRDTAVKRVFQCTAFKTHHAKLDGDEKTLFLTFSMFLARLQIDLASFLHLADINPGCSQRGECSVARLCAISEVQDCMQVETGPVPLDLCEWADIWSTLEEGCCMACYDCLEEAHARARQLVWDKLPEICELPPWPELEKMKAEALGP